LQSSPFHLTSSGRKLARSEAERLADFLRVARAKKILRGDYGRILASCRCPICRSAATTAMARTPTGIQPDGFPMDFVNK
jgi:hypothetical protein